jgi:hypothetical protein
MDGLSIRPSKCEDARTTNSRTSDVLPFKELCGAAGGIGSASLGLAHRGCATWKKSRPNEPRSSRLVVQVSYDRSTFASVQYCSVLGTY